MKQILFLLFLIPLLTAQALEKEATSAIGNDNIILTSGKNLAGRILTQSKDAVILMMNNKHISIPKNEITRVYDRPDGDLVYTEILPRSGSFPPWWVPAYDLFYSDTVQHFEQIPAIVIDNGTFQNVPYLSFRANKYIEINIYGDPNHPAGLEIGIYGHRRSSAAAQKDAREFITSYLHGLKEIRALDALPATGGRTEVNGMMMEITPPTAPDAYGGWWVSIWYPKALEKAKVAPEALKKITNTYSEVVKNAVSSTSWDKKELAASQRKLVKSAHPLIYTQ